MREGDFLPYVGDGNFILKYGGERYSIRKGKDNYCVLKHCIGFGCGGHDKWDEVMVPKTENLEKDIESILCAFNVYPRHA